MRAFKQYLLDPAKTMKIHAGFVLLFILLIPPSAIWWANSVPYLVGLSVWALISGHWSAWQSAHAEHMEQSGVSNEEIIERIDRLEELLTKEKE